VKLPDKVRKMGEQLKAAQAEHKIRLRQYNAAQRALHSVLVTINTLEKKIELARDKQSAH
jgi:hypothetical protein